MVLVTGGAGFIGSHVVELLLQQGEEVRVLDDLSTGRRENLEGLDAELVVGSIVDRGAVRKSLVGCDGVIHLAAKPGVPGSCEDPLGYDHTNVHGTVVVFEEARVSGIRRVVYASSSAVYGSSDVSPKREDQPLLCESPYAASKAANEQYGRAFSQTLGLECVGLRYFNVFGPRQDPEGPYAAVIPRFITRGLRGEPLTVFGDGEQTRDFVYVGDVARANLAALRAPGGAGRAFNVGTGGSLTIRELAVTVADATGGRSQVSYLPPRAGDVLHSMADISAATEAFGWTPTEGLDSALSLTVDDYRQE